MNRVFLGLGACSLVTAVVYWFTSYEEAGTTMLVLAGGLSLLTGTYLLLGERGRSGGAIEDPAEAAYLPHASVWPFGIGVASFFVVNGLILGSWFLVPGGIVLVATVVGFAAQSRARRLS